LLSSSAAVPFLLLSTFGPVGGWVEAEATYAPFCIVARGDAHGVLLVGGLDVDVLRGALLPYILAACYWAALSLKRPPCDNEVF
jgi:hypothetical protein